MQIPSLFIIIGGLFIGLLIFFVPRAGMVFIILGTLFLPEIPVVPGSDSLTHAIEIRAEDLFIVVITLGWFIGLTARRTSLQIPRTPLNAPIIIFSILMIISSIWGAFNETTSTSAAFFFTLKRIQYFLIFFMVLANIKTLSEVKLNITLLFIFTSVVSIWGMIEYNFNPDVRASGPFRTDQNALLGGFLLLVSFVAVAFISRYPRWPLRICLLPLVIMALYAIAFTTSRASYVGLMAGLIIFPLLSRRLYLLFLPPLLLFASIYLLPSSVIEATHSIQGVWARDAVINPSWDSRVEAWIDAATNRIPNHLILGHGPGSFPLSWLDNQYMTELLYLGFLGLGLFLWLIRRIFAGVLPMLAIGPPNYSELSKTGGDIKAENKYYTATLSLGYITALVALLVQGIAVANFYTVRIMVPFWYLTGLVMIARELTIPVEPGQDNLGNIQDPGSLST